MPVKTPPLDERLNVIRAEVDAFIDAKVAEVKETCPGLPDGVLRQTIVGNRCLCVSYFAIRRAEDEQAARESAA